MQFFCKFDTKVIVPYKRHNKTLHICNYPINMWSQTGMMLKDACVEWKKVREDYKTTMVNIDNASEHLEKLQAIKYSLAQEMADLDVKVAYLGKTLIDEQDEEAFDSYIEDLYNDDIYDVYVQPRERKTRADVRTVYEAIKSNKASKQAKLRPRSPSRDKTKTKDSKKTAQSLKFERMIK